MRKNTILILGLILGCSSILLAQSDIYLYNESSGTTTQVTSLPGNEFNPTVSSNGRSMVFDALGVGIPLGHALYGGSLKSGSFSLIAGSDGGNDASFGPRGRNIVYDRIPAGDFNIYELPLAGGTPTLMIHNGISPDWSRNGRFIAYVDASSGMISIHNVRTGSSASIGVEGSHPSWSPNGRYLAYSFNNHIYYVNIDRSGNISGLPIQLTSGSRLDSHPTWSRNNNSVIYASIDAAFSNSDIYIVGRSSGSPGVYTGNPSDQDYDPAMAGGNNIVYAVLTTSASPQASPASSEIGIDASVFPNKTRDRANLTIKISEQQFYQVALFDYSGKVIRNIYSGVLKAGNYNFETSIGQENPVGPYLINIRSKSENVSVALSKM